MTGIQTCALPISNSPNMVPIWSQRGPKMIQTWSQNGPSLVPKWSQSDPNPAQSWYQLAAIWQDWGARKGGTGYKDSVNFRTSGDPNFNFRRRATARRSVNPNWFFKWLAGRPSGRTDGRLDGWTAGWTAGWLDGWMQRWMAGWLGSVVKVGRK